MAMRRPLLVSLFAALAGVAALAHAQQPISALKGHNSNAPVDVTADRIEVQDRADRAIFVGNVHVRQADLTLDTSRLTVAYSSTGGIQIERLDASGGVVVRSPSETARGNFGVYDLDRRLITLVGDVQRLCVARLAGVPVADQREIVAAELFAPDALPPDCARYVPNRLERAMEALGSQQR